MDEPPEHLIRCTLHHAAVSKELIVQAGAQGYRAVPPFEQLKKAGFVNERAVALYGAILAHREVKPV